MTTRTPIYLDYAATCPADPRVVRAMDGAWQAANTASSHPRGQKSKELSIECRRALAQVIGAKPREVVWTSGATEADNLAIKGYAESAENPHIITIATEHKAVLRSAETTAAWGARVTVLPVDERGQLDLDELAEVVEPGALVSAMLVNNETGGIHPIAEVAEICLDAGALLHCDATQALGRVPVRVNVLGDMVSLSAHKVYGPKGIGCLWLREGVELAPQICGGRQERGLRAGTTPVPLCVGFAKAAELAAEKLEQEHGRLAKLRQQLLADLGRRGVFFSVNGAGAPTVPAICSLAFPHTDGEKLLQLVSKEVCVSTGSACNLDGPSHVMAAMGVPEDVAVLRITLGRWTTARDVSRAAEVVERAARRARV